MPRSRAILPLIAVLLLAGSAASVRAAGAAGRAHPAAVLKGQCSKSEVEDLFSASHGIDEEAMGRLLRCDVLEKPTQPGANAAAIDVPAGSRFAVVDVIGAAGATPTYRPEGGTGGEGAEVATILKTRAVHRLYVQVGETGSEAIADDLGGGLSAVCTRRILVAPGLSSARLAKACPVVAGGGGAGGASGAIFAFGSGEGVGQDVNSYLGGGDGGQAGPSPAGGIAGAGTADSAGGQPGQAAPNVIGAFRGRSSAGGGKGGAPIGSTAPYGQQASDGGAATGISGGSGGLAPVDELGYGGAGGEGIFGGGGGGGGAVGYDASPLDGPTTGRQGSGAGGGAGGSFVNTAATAASLFGRHSKPYELRTASQADAVVTIAVFGS